MNFAAYDDLAMDGDVSKPPPPKEEVQKWVIPRVSEPVGGGDKTAIASRRPLMFAIHSSILSVVD